MSGCGGKQGPSASSRHLQATLPIVSNKPRTGLPGILCLACPATHRLCCRRRCPGLQGAGGWCGAGMTHSLVTIGAPFLHHSAGVRAPGTKAPQACTLCGMARRGRLSKRHSCPAMLICILHVIARALPAAGFMLVFSQEPDVQHSPWPHAFSPFQGAPLLVAIDQIQPQGGRV